MIIEGLPSLSLRALTGRLRRVDFPFDHPAPDCTPRDDAAPQSELQSGDILITKYSRNGGVVRTDRRLLDGTAAALTSTWVYAYLASASSGLAGAWASERSKASCLRHSARLFSWIANCTCVAPSASRTNSHSHS